jgi:hypothetical protein
MEDFAQVGVIGDSWRCPWFRSELAFGVEFGPEFLKRVPDTQLTGIGGLKDAAKVFGQLSARE